MELRFQVIPICYKPLSFAGQSHLNVLSGRYSKLSDSISTRTWLYRSRTTLALSVGFSIATTVLKSLRRVIEALVWR